MTWRHGIAAAWLLLQGLLIVTAGRRPDRAFGFRMFNESSTLEAHLARRVDAPSGHGTLLLPVQGGAWTAVTRGGERRRFAWSDRVKEPGLNTFDVTVHASYGVDAQVARWQAAVDDVARHLAEDSETRGLELTLCTRRNARPAVTMRFEAATPESP